MKQDNNQFVLKVLTINRSDDEVETDSSWATVISAWTAVGALSKLAEILKNPSGYNAYFSEILGFRLLGNGKHMMEFYANHTTFRLDINWRHVEFFNFNRDLLEGLKQVFPEQAVLLKGLALDEGLGL